MAHPQRPKQSQETRLTKRQQQALELHVNGSSKKHICEAVNISLPTLNNWIKMPAWQLAVDQEIDYLQGEGTMIIKALLPLATRTLQKLMVTGADNIKLGAARTLMEAHAHLSAQAETKELITGLEERLEVVQNELGQQALPPVTGDPIDVSVEAPESDSEAVAPDVAPDPEQDGARTQQELDLGGL